MQYNQFIDIFSSYSSYSGAAAVTSTFACSYKNLFGPLDKCTQNTHVYECILAMYAVHTVSIT